MGGSIVDICNLALGNIGASAQISSLSERSKEAQECARFYDHARRRTLRALDWPFARVIAPLALVDLPAISPYLYRYAMPPGVLAFRQIEPRDVLRTRVRYEIAGTEVGGRAIHTSQAGAVGRWTKDEERSTEFDEGFVATLAWALAADISMPLTRSQQKQRNAYEMFRAMRSEAEPQAMNEEPRNLDESDRQAEWIRARP